MRRAARGGFRRGGAILEDLRTRGCGARGSCGLVRPSRGLTRPPCGLARPRGRNSSTSSRRGPHEADSSAAARFWRTCTRGCGARGSCGVRRGGGRGPLGSRATVAWSARPAGLVRPPARNSSISSRVGPQGADSRLAGAISEELRTLGGGVRGPCGLARTAATPPFRYAWGRRRPIPGSRTRFWRSCAHGGGVRGRRGHGRVSGARRRRASSGAGRARKSVV